MAFGGSPAFTAGALTVTHRRAPAPPVTIGRIPDVTHASDHEKISAAFIDLSFDR
jgi:hypothetical protein